MTRHVLVLLESLPYPMDPRVRGQVAALREAGFDVTVACPTGPRNGERDVIVDGIRVRRFKAPRAGRGALGSLLESGVAFLRLWVVGRKRKPVPEAYGAHSPAEAPMATP